MNRDELLSLPATVGVETAGQAIGLGRTLAYSLAARDEFPVRVMRLGNRYRVITADLWALLGIEPEPRKEADHSRQEVSGLSPSASPTDTRRQANYDADR